ncbi:MAG: hypothetical protein NWQ23_05410 [Yoonia sp.]|uniref:hypothetical protein n=1 Tax=Yoonia sp. TaxID=2212373 RepID=UPI00273EFB87|nr:hypothetical protein [Yoonia sp.]MDP5084840.1 hypothetical protein [Yoonia sp.]
MPTAKQDINDFRDRVKRIGNPRNTSYYDRDLGMEIPKRVSHKEIKKKNKKPSVLSTLLVSVILGGLGLMFAQVVRIRYFGLTEPSNLVLYLELFIAFWAVVMLAALMDRRKTSERIAQVVGVAVMMVAGHNIIWRWPDQLAIIYTPAHVEQVLETTTQHSVVVRGSVYGL